MGIEYVSAGEHKVDVEWGPPNCCCFIIERAHHFHGNQLLFFAIRLNFAQPIWVACNHVVSS